MRANARWAALVGCVQMACLLPPPVEELVSVPNLPPRIDTDNITPDPTEGPKHMTTQCIAYQFFAGVTDPDPEDMIYWRVFLDYYLQPDGELLGTEIRSTTPGSLINFSVDPSDRRFFTTGIMSNVHVVELFITDRPFSDIPRQPYARLVEPPGITDSFVWTIDLNNSDSCSGD